ncbi:hypothetical protein Cgig2_002909 [Carnegiea gigantea]|uniref:Uncharacterized protein n=1 Tax=Carnegiea gigantea TaxID=171969 RepID=A0A9Q1GN35_9CARY|nr:hypothetical protein Cgig2_002909 [Carnegiea gigantea]
MAVMKPNLLLKKYHAKSPISLGVLWTVCTRLNARAVQVKMESETAVESRAINCYTLGRWLVHGRIRLGDYKSVPCRQEQAGAPGNSGHSATISRTNPTADRALILRTDLPLAEEDVSPEEELVLVEATSAAGFGGLVAEQVLPWVRSTSNSFGLWMWGVDFVLAIRLRQRGGTEFKKGYRVRDLFGFLTLIFWGHACNHPAINKGREAWELRVAALHLGGG